MPIKKAKQKEILYPHRRYILSSLLLGKSIQDITDDCQSYMFDPPDSVTVDAYRKQLKGMFPKFDKLNPDYDSLLTMDIYHMVCYELEQDSTAYPLNLPMPPLGIEGAFRILEDPHMRRLITVLSLGNIQDEDIELIVNARYSYDYASEDVRMFVHYFSDFSKYKFKDKQEYVLSMTDKHARKQFSYALKGDKNMLLWKMGLAPDKSFDMMLRDIGMDCFYNYREQLTLNDQSEAQKWATLLLKVQERLEKLDAEDADKKDLFGSLVFQVQAMKANTAVLTPENVDLEMPTYATTSDGRQDILSLEKLENLTNDTTNSIEEQQKSSEDNEERLRGEHSSS